MQSKRLRNLIGTVAVILVIAVLVWFLADEPTQDAPMLQESNSAAPTPVSPLEPAIRDKNRVKVEQDPSMNAVVPAPPEVSGVTRYFARGRIQVDNAIQSNLNGRVEVTFDERLIFPDSLRPSSTLDSTGLFSVEFTNLIAHARTDKRTKYVAKVTGNVLEESAVSFDVSDAVESTDEIGQKIRVVALEIRTVVTARIRGRCIDQEGVPIAQALVCIVSTGSDPDPFDTRKQTNTAEDGTFTIQAPSDVPFFLLCLKTGFVPYRQRQELAPGERVQAPDLLLIGGEEVSGTVLPSVHTLGYQVSLMSSRAGVKKYYQLESGYQGLVWSESRVDWFYIGFTPKSTHFSVGGLVSEPYWISLEQSARPECTVPRVAENIFVVTPPAHDIFLSDQASRVSLSIVHDGAPVGGATVEVRDAGSVIPTSADANGNCDLVLRPNETFGISVTAEGFAIHEQTVLAPLKGTRIHLSISLFPE